MSDKMNRIAVSAVIMAILMPAAVSCTENIITGETDLRAYSNVGKLNGYVMDLNSGKRSNIVELRAADHNAALSFCLTMVPYRGIDVQFNHDAGYAETYNAEHGTDYPLFPEELVVFDNDGSLVIAPDEKQSCSMGMKIIYDPEKLQDGSTYILPVRASVPGGDVSVPEDYSVCTYLVNVYDTEDDTFKGEGAVKTVMLFEVNDTNPLNALEFVLDNGSDALFFDFIVLFAANINYNEETGRVYVSCNDNVQFLLDNNEQYLQPLRRRGIKVLLGLLGNHDAAGLAQLSETGAKDFARELAAICHTYNLDGVTFDDEYSNTPDLDNPLLAQKSSDAGARLCYETKLAMPDKYMSIYSIGSIGSRMPASVDGTDASEFIDFIVADYGRSAQPIGNIMTKRQCAGMSLELFKEPSSGTEADGRSTVSGGYGYFMFFGLYAGDSRDLRIKNGNQIKSCGNVCRGLYGTGLKPVEYFYPQYSTERVILENYIKENGNE